MPSVPDILYSELATVLSEAALKRFLQLGFLEEIEIDGFAGGGGTSTGLEGALGRSPAVAINHDKIALAMHEVNHPETEHIQSEIWEVHPRKATRGRPVGLGWFSPDCKHFSKAKGGKPVEKKIRGLAWVVVHWANVVAPRIIIVENVEEFQTWGPLGADNKPCPIQKGHTFKRWIGELERLGYVVEWRELRACDYGAPTIRKRLFLIARRDGEPIIWPMPTHGDPKSDAVKSGRLKPWRTAAEIIDWSLPCPSIFDTAEEIMEKYGLRAVRPLQPATMARIAKGVKRYVLDAAKPFIVNLTHHGEGQAQAVDDPLATVTAAHRGEKAVVTPFVTGVGGRMAQTEPRAADQPAQTLTAKADSVLVAPYLARTAHGDVDKNGKKRGQGTHSLQDPHGTVLASPDHALITPFISAAQQGGSVRPVDDPLHTVTASNKDQNQIIVPTLIQTGYGERAGQEPRVPGLDKPLGTAVAGGVKHGLIAPHLTKFRANSVGSGMDEPAPTVTANSFIKRAGGAAPIGLVAPHLMTMRNAQKPFNEANKPTHTITSGGAHMHLVAAFMAQHNYLEPGHDAREPVSTIVGKGSTQAVVSAGLTVLKGSDRRDSEIDAPAPTATAQGGHIAETRAFLTKYYGVDQDPRLEEPLHTATAKDRFGLCTVDIEGETYVITDIGMRMLTPRELFRAQGFPDSYIIDRKPDGSPITKTEQVSKCGNSVCPPMAAALVKANYAPRDLKPAPQFMEAAE
jgi:DNA (cytosine-5)-methyltransferase 1